MAEKLGKDETIARQVTCKSCGTIHKYWKVDVKCSNNEDNYYNYIKCLECSDPIKVKEWNWG